MAQTLGFSSNLKRGTNSSHTGIRLSARCLNRHTITLDIMEVLLPHRFYQGSSAAVEHDAPGNTSLTRHDHHRIAGIMWTKRVRRVIPINVGTNGPKRRRNELQHKRILSRDARHGTVSLYCCKSYPTQTASRISITPDGAALSGLHNFTGARSLVFGTFSK